MLVSRSVAPEQSFWHGSKPEPAYYPTNDKLRMSSHFDAPLPTPSDWQGPGHYAFLPPSDAGLFAGSCGDAARTAVAEARSDPSPPSPRPSLDPLGPRQQRPPTPIPEPDLEAQREQPCPPKSKSVEPAVASEESQEGQGPSPAASTAQAAEDPAQPRSTGGEVSIKDDEEELLEDEEMMEADGVDAGGGDQPNLPMTAAERTAARRKMKRFRLTHQQTRFLMSEFAKQPHPDAAHRDRLSREIPGLSPRQVQVWFQNRRAKIKRLTVDDRDRMIKMRAVPDDFDNVSALHSPYGAVHGISSAVEFGSAPYADPLLRPLMVDARRHDGDEHLSPTGISPGFGNNTFNPSPPLTSPDLLSPLSQPPMDRHGFLPGGPRSNPFGRQPASLDSGLQVHKHQQPHHPGQPVQLLQPLQLREAMNRSRSDALQSPLRSSMSWKGDAINYTTYHGRPVSPQLNGRQSSVYATDQMSSSSSSGLGGYETSNYSASAVHSPSTLIYTGFSPSTLQPSQQSQQDARSSRMRSASAALPPGLDLSTPHYRSVSSAGYPMHSPSHSAGHRTPSTPHFPHHHAAATSTATASYSASFPSAPLTSPVDFAIPRTPAFPGQQHPHSHPPQHSQHPDYAMPQMSAPIAPPNDFSQALKASMARTPIRDGFGHVSSTAAVSAPTTSAPMTATVVDHHSHPHHHPNHHHHHHHHRQSPTHGAAPGDDYAAAAAAAAGSGDNSLGMKRHHSFSPVCMSVASGGSDGYGHGGSV